MCGFHHMVVKLVYPRKGRRYHHQDNILEEYEFCVRDNIFVDAKLIFCVGNKQTQKSVHYDFEKDNQVDKQKLIEFIEFIQANYEPNNRHADLLSPDNYDKAFVYIGKNEYVLTKGNPDVERLLQIMNYGFHQTMLEKEKLALLQSEYPRKPIVKGIIPYELPTT